VVAVVSQLPSDVDWRQAYTDKFGAGAADFADLYYDAAGIVISDLEATSTINSAGNLIVNRAALARAVRNTAGYPGVTCAITLDPTTGNRVDDPAALSKCALG
jgi:ABC-type branched-subunit amino acid transport system substrate-binding protein